MKSHENVSIARVIARLNVGGPAIQAILLTDEFRRKGWQTFLFTGEVPNGEASMEYFANAKGVEPIKVGSLSRRICPGKDLATLWHLWRHFRRERPTIVHSHTAKAGTLGRIAALLAGVPITVHTFHGHVFRGYFSKPVSWLFIIIERILAARTDRIVAISDSQRKELSDVFRIAPADKIEVVPLGFELEPFLNITRPSGAFRNWLRCDSVNPIVGWIGRFAPIKAPDLFLDCAAEMASPAAYFVMVGDGILRESCERRILRENLSSFVQITGWRKDLPDIYSDLDLLVSTSINEGTAVSLLEAMASGTPVVATDVGGTRDLMVGSPAYLDGMEIYKNAILVRRDRSSLIRAIRFLLERPSLRSSMGRAGREFVRVTFSVKRLTDDLERLYLTLAKSKGVAAMRGETSFVSTGFCGSRISED